MKKLFAPLFMIALAVLTLRPVQTGAGSSGHVHDAQGQIPAAALPAALQATLIQFGGLTIGNAYSPPNVFIKPGETITWQGDFVTHPLVSDEGLWTSVSAGTQFDFVFNTPGVYHFHCLIHGPFGMTGTVTVGYRIFLADVYK